MSLSTQAQDYLTHTFQLTTEQGKPYPPVHGISQDQLGYLWMAMPNGIGRYTGQEISIYPDIREHIRGNRILKMMNLGADWLWVWSRSRIGATTFVDLINVHSLEVIPFEQHFKNSPVEAFLGSMEMKYRQSKLDQIDLAISGSLYQFTADSAFLIKAFSINSKIQHYHYTPAGNYWVAVSYRNQAKPKGKQWLYYINKKGTVLDSLLLTPDSDHLITAECIHVYPDESILLSCTERIAPRKEQTYNLIKPLYQAPASFSFSTQKAYRHQLYHPKEQQIWCSNHLSNTISCFDLKGQFIYETPILKGFWGVELRDGIFDRQGGFWWLADNKTYRVQVEKNKFNVYLNDWVEQKVVKKQNIEYNFACRGIFKQENGDLLVGGSGGFVTVKSKKDYAYHPSYLVSQQQKKTTLSNARVAVWQEHENLIWVTDENRGLIAYRPQEDTTQVYSYIPPNQKKTKLHWSIHRDRQQRLWLGHIKGLSYLNEATGFLEFYEDSNFPLLNKSSVFDFHENAAGIWLATSTGLYLFDPEKGAQQHYSPQNQQLPHQNITHIHEDEAGHFWLASKGGGLIYFNPNNLETRQITIDSGLSNNTIYAVYEDQQQRLWMSSNDGINCYHKNTGEIIIYTTFDGLPHKEFNTISHHQAADGSLYFGGLNGFVAFHPKDFNTTAINTTPISITSIKIFLENTNSGEHELAEMITPDLEQMGTLKIWPDYYLANLNFTLLDYRKPYYNQYAYAIKGDNFNKNWYTVSPASVPLKGLPYGYYKLYLKARGANGLWTKPKVIDLHIVLPFYLRPYFLIGLLIALLLGTWGIIALRTRSYKKRQLELELTVAQRTQQLQQKTELLEEQAEELKALDRLKSRFFANISHELRTPLTLILGPLSFILDQPKAISPSIYRQLGTMQRNGKKLLQLIEEILDLAKLEAGKLELDELAIGLKGFLEKIYGHFEAQAQLKSIDFVLEFADDLDRTILIDPEKVEKILLNLLSNAFKFTPEQGKITFKASRQSNDLLQLEVMDTGQGIAATDLPHIFERFFQTKQSDKPVKGGTGIGLSLCQELANLMEGTISASSTLNEGSHFVVQIPLKEVTSNTKNNARTNPSTSIVKVVGTEVEAVFDPSLIEAGQEILLVEDNPEVTAFLKELLQENYQLHFAEHGLAALDFLNQASALPKLIISDIMMPKMDGFELLKALKEHSDYQKIPVIMLTAKTAEQDKLKALRTGVDDYLTKPFSTRELLARVQNLIYNAQLRQQFTQAPSLISTNSAAIPEVEEPHLAEHEQEWLEEIEGLAKKQADDPDFNGFALAESSNMSESTLKRKLKKLVGLTPGQYLKEIRLQTARELLDRGVYPTMTEVAYATGFRTPHYFSKEFEKRFGKKVSSYF